MRSALYDFLRSHRGLSVFGVEFRSMTVFNYILEAALACAILTLVILFIRAVFRKHISRKVVCVAWLLVALRVFMPIALPNPLMNELRPAFSTDGEARPVADQFRVRFQDALSDLSWQVESAAIDKALAQGEDAETYFREHRSPVASLLLDAAAVTSYGWTGKWFLIGWAAIAAVTGLALGIRRYVRRKKERITGCQILADAACALQWFNPFVWIAARTARKDLTALRTASPEASPRTAGKVISAVSMVLVAALFAGSFFVAEAEPGNLNDRKNAVGIWLDDPYPTPAELYGKSWTNGNERDIQTEEEAIARAQEIADSPMIQQSLFDFSASRLPEGWAVMANDFGGRFAAMLIAPDGTLLDYVRDVSAGTHLPYQAVRPGNMDDVLLSAAEYLSADCLGKAAVTGYSFKEDTFLNEDRYMRFEAEVDNRTASFTFCVSDGLKLTEYHIPHASTAAVSMADACRAALDALRSAGISPVGIRMVITHRDQPDTWLADIILPDNSPIPADLMGQLGEMPRYRCSVSIPADGSAPGSLVWADLTAPEAELPENAETEVLRMPMETHLALGRALYVDEIIPAGTEYTILRQANPETDKFAAEESPNRWMLVRYHSPRYGADVDRWMRDALYNAGYEASNSHTLSGTELRTVILTVDGSHQSFTVPMLDYKDGKDEYMLPGDWRAPKENEVSMEQALQIAIDALTETYAPVTAQELLQYAVRYGLYAKGGYWQFDIYMSEQYLYEVEVDAATGEVRYMCGGDEGNG
ncbi:MAG: PepSY domain-containing protein [Clostridia bacterium]|nr:PepSY domain-containing protein [Clostridia bacterium]